jgi:MoxR-like ATPase
LQQDFPRASRARHQTVREPLVNELKDLQALIGSRFPIVIIEAVEEQRVQQAVGRIARALDVPLFSWTVVQGLMREGSDKPFYDTLEPAKALANIAGIKREAIYFLKDLERFLDQPAVMRLVLDLVVPFARDRRALVLSGPNVRVPAELEPFTARFRLSLPDRDDMRALTRQVLESLSARQDLHVTLNPAQMNDLIDSLVGLTRFEAERLLHRVVLDDSRLTPEDITTVRRQKRDRLAQDALLDISSPGKGDTGIGGMANLRDWLRRRSLSVSDEAREFGIQAPRGILLLGVQGCGKSAAASAIAAEWDVPLARLEVARLYDRYIGETEQRLERALAAAERLAPCVLLVDEIEKALAQGGAGVDGGLSQRVTGRLLTWLQDREAPVFVVATCNAASELPPELMRKGRFDEVFFVDLPTTAERAEIFATHLQRRGRTTGRFDLQRLAAAAAGFSGAEIEAAVVAALHTAFNDGGRLLDRHLLDELAATRPLSVLRAEEIAALQRWAAGRAVPASADTRAA